MNNQNSPNSGNNGLLKILLGLAAVVILVLGYMLFNANQKTESQESIINQKIEELTTVRTRLDSISTQLDAKIAEIKELGGKVEELERLKARLNHDKAELKNTSKFDKSTYEEKIQEYIALLSEKDQQISKLRSENESLVKEKGILTQEKEGVVRENTGLRAEREVLTQSVTEERTKNEELSKKVRIGAQLKAINIQVLAVNSRGKVQDGGNYKSKKMNQLLVIFNLPSNPLTEQNEKEIILRILDPTGAVISDSALGSGIFQFNGIETAYTSKKIIEYTSNDQRVEMLFSRGENSRYNSGNYTVELYAEGFKIGQGVFSVK
jgi:peptidoglycan hydrolase CwlO-like protein